MNKKVAVFFKDPEPKGYPFDKDEYWVAYQELDKEFHKLGARFYIVRSNDTYLGNGTFSKSWQFKDGDLVETGEITVDKIYDKGSFKTDGKISVLNNEIINRICNDDKYETYKLFKKYCPETILVNNEEEFLKALFQIKGNKKVIKPIDGSCGKDVFIGDDEYLKNCQYKFPLLVQEFLDTSDGIPGIYQGIHDLRIIFINNEIGMCFFRTPPKGGLLANVSLGGSSIVVDHDCIPQSVLKIAKEVNQHLSQYGDRIFSVDFGFGKGKPKIIELNSSVGLQENKRYPTAKIFKEKLTKFLLK
jgi:glutathione synthase/RimK-type ligase-like ATP-grasp enzyme